VRDPATSTILIVDDDPLVGRALGRVAGRFGRVTVLHDTRAALHGMAEGARFDVILCEAMMPALTGIEFRRVLEKSDPEQARRIIFMTWDAFHEPIREGLGQVENETLEKPISSDSLAQVLLRYLG
jgi:CheY-like chemotaxis protein